MFEEVPVPDEVKLSVNDADALGWCRDAFIEAQNARRQYEKKWLRFYKIYRAHVDKKPGDWRSKNFWPIVFYTVQSILPKMIAQLPQPIVLPVGPQDEQGAPKMEDALAWAAELTKLQLRIFEMFWSALVYGTGIIKVSAKELTVQRYRQTPIMQDLTVDMPVIDPDTGQPMMGIDGQPMTSGSSLGQVPTGRTKQDKTKQTIYMGPVGESVDIFNIFPAPEASDTTDCRYLIHQSWMPRDWVDRKIKDGFFTLPKDMPDPNFMAFNEDPKFMRLAEVGYGGARAGGRTSKMCELWEVWRDDGTVTTVLNENYIVRRVRNPYDHGRFPFVRAVDHLIPGEFWGQGEAEILEGPQDMFNTLSNSRMDNVRMVLSRMFMVDEQALIDPREITRLRPGGFVRVNNPNGLPIQNIIAPIDFGEVTSSSYTETEAIERQVEKISGMSPFNTGTDMQNVNDAGNTATGIALIAEQGNTRISMKTSVNELGGLSDLFHLYGSTLQQFTPPDMLMRVVGPDGVQFIEVGADAIEGAYDYQIEGSSSTITESVRRQQDQSLLEAGMNLIDPATGGPLANIKSLWEDMLRDFGKKDIARYINQPPPQPPMGGQQLPPELAALVQGQGQGLAAPVQQQLMGGAPPAPAGAPPMAPPTQNGGPPA